MGPGVGGARGVNCQLPAAGCLITMRAEEGEGNLCRRVISRPGMFARHPTSLASPRTSNYLSTKTGIKESQEPRRNRSS